MADTGEKGQYGSESDVLDFNRVWGKNKLSIKLG